MKKARIVVTAFLACALAIGLSVPSFGAVVSEEEQGGQSGQPVEHPEGADGTSPDVEQPSEDQMDKPDKNTSGSSASKADGAAGSKGAAEKTKKPEKLTASEKKLISKASGYSSKAASLVSRLSAPADDLAEKTASLEKQREQLFKLKKKRADVDVDIRGAQAALSNAQAEFERVLEEESSLTDISYYSVLFGKVKYNDLVKWSSDISKRESDAHSELASRQKALEDLNAKAQSLDKKIEKRQGSIEKAVASGNDKAVELEKADSESRMADEDAAQQVEKLDTEKPKAKAAVEDVEKTVKRHDATRSSSREALASWYDQVDDISNVESSLIFGTGVDFALAEEDFVGKWGNAIDAFYEQFGSEAGFTPPLAGQGKTMAKYAYEYKVDPRLCAAVSIIESSGGKHCIKAHNAWGWGAADSDPYGGAASWGSWDEAIREWHKGMTESNTGLATAGSVSELGEIYCSSAHWAKGVSEQFEKIDACVK